MYICEARKLFVLIDGYLNDISSCQIWCALCRVLLCKYSAQRNFVRVKDCFCRTTSCLMKVKQRCDADELLLFDWQLLYFLFLT